MLDSKGAPITLIPANPGFALLGVARGWAAKQPAHAELKYQVPVEWHHPIVAWCISAVNSDCGMACVVPVTFDGCKTDLPIVLRPDGTVELFGYGVIRTCADLALHEPGIL